MFFECCIFQLAAAAASGRGTTRTKDRSPVQNRQRVQYTRQGDRQLHAPQPSSHRRSHALTTQSTHSGEKEATVPPPHGLAASVGPHVTTLSVHVVITSSTMRSVPVHLCRLNSECTSLPKPRIRPSCQSKMPERRRMHPQECQTSLALATAPVAHGGAGAGSAITAVRDAMRQSTVRTRLRVGPCRLGARLSWNRSNKVWRVLGAASPPSLLSATAVFRSPARRRLAASAFARPPA